MALFVISGISAAGKSTVARLLAGLGVVDAAERTLAAEKPRAADPATSLID